MLQERASLERLLRGPAAGAPQHHPRFEAHLQEGRERLERILCLSAAAGEEEAEEDGGMRGGSDSDSSEGCP